MPSSVPFFSIVTPVYETPLDVLDEMIASVQNQSWPDWELILVDDLSPSAAVREHLAAAAALDERLVVVHRETNGGISAASNDGIAAARGQFIALLDHDDLLGAGALTKVAAILQADPEIDYLYTDEDKVDAHGNRYDIFRKPDWSPERLRAQMYCAHLSVMRSDLVREVGGFDSAYDGSQDHDLILKITERARRIHHLPEVLYHWRALPQSTASSGDAKPYTWDAGARAVAAHVERIGLDATVTKGTWFGTYAIHRRFDATLKSSIIIPTRGSSGLVGGVERVYIIDAVRSIIAKAGTAPFEVVVVADTTTPKPVVDQLTTLLGDRLVLVWYDKPFNYSEKCNLGFVASTGEIIILLNDDVEVIVDDFIAELAAPLSQPDVGMTGAYLIYENGGVQNAGHRYAERGFKHAFSDYSLGDPGPFCALMVDREVSGLTAACVAMRREVFAEVGGLSETLPVNFNDVDLSLKLRRAGYRLVWLNRVKLYHYESKSRVPIVHPWELALVRARWGTQQRDSYIEEELEPVPRRRRAGLTVA
jgi:glycosyltransferase involved in cell wall biosynthesis